MLPLFTATALILSSAVILTTLTTTCDGQRIQSGLLYWCSFVEGGSNFANYGGSRANWLGYNSGSWSAPCHLPYSSAVITPQWGDGYPYIYSNGSSYPYSDYTTKIAPSSCLVGILRRVLQSVPECL